MRQFVSVSDVDDLLGDDWADDEKKYRAVLMANAWLNGKNLPDIDPMPEEWKTAGAEIAKEASKGNLYREIETGVLSKSVNADSVSVSKSYSATAKNLSAGEAFALALIEPWIKSQGKVFMLKRT